ncbi:MAG: DivIVA domain-containing protein [Aerococcaceae bacterium]|nr:DivIVA domain-containing protein [Aerococcaceae bacterium]
MPELKRSLISGYTVESVHQVMEALQQQCDTLTKKIKQQEEQINELKNECNNYRNKEQLITDALLDAKQLSKTIITDAQLFATNVRKTTEDEITERMQSFQRSMAQLETVKREIVTQEEVLKLELKNVLNKYMDVVDTTEIPEFHEAKEKLELAFRHTEAMLAQKASKL